MRQCPRVATHSEADVGCHVKNIRFENFDPFSLRAGTGAGTSLFSREEEIVAGTRPGWKVDSTFGSIVRVRLYKVDGLPTG